MASSLLLPLVWFVVWTVGKPVLVGCPHEDFVLCSSTTQSLPLAIRLQTIGVPGIASSERPFFLLPDFHEVQVLQFQVAGAEAMDSFLMVPTGSGRKSGTLEEGAVSVQNS